MQGGQRERQGGARERKRAGWEPSPSQPRTQSEGQGRRRISLSSSADPAGLLNPATLRDLQLAGQG